MKINEVHFEAEECVLVSETTVLKNGVHSNLPTMDWKQLEVDVFHARIIEGFNARGAWSIFEQIENPPRDYLSAEGWYHVTIPQPRHGIVGRWTGGLRIRRREESHDYNA